jgi:hypothetical protein
MCAICDELARDYGLTLQLRHTMAQYSEIMTHAIYCLCFVNHYAQAGGVGTIIFHAEHEQGIYTLLSSNDWNAILAMTQEEWYAIRHEVAVALVQLCTFYSKYMPAFAAADAVIARVVAKYEIGYGFH